MNDSDKEYATKRADHAINLFLLSNDYSRENIAGYIRSAIIDGIERGREQERELKTCNNPRHAATEAELQSLIEQGHLLIDE